MLGDLASGVDFVLSCAMKAEEEAVRAEKRILVVEDHSFSAKLLCHFLKKSGFSFDWVETGADAVARCGEVEYDAILMDVKLPGMNGIEATRQIIDQANLTRPPIIVGVTASPRESELEECFEVGMAEVFRKPVDFDRLQRFLERRLLPSQIAGRFVPKANVHPGEIPSSGIFDRAVATAFLGRMGGTSTLYEGPIELFFASIDESLNRLDAAVGTDDRLEIERWAHTLKGSAGLVGARDLEDFAKGLELVASDGSSHFQPKHWLPLIVGAAESLKEAMMAEMCTR